MNKHNPIFTLLLAIMFTFATIGVSAAASKQDSKFSVSKCEGLGGGKVTDKYFGKSHNGKICLFQYAPDRGATLCNKKWRK